MWRIIFLALSVGIPGLHSETICIWQLSNCGRITIVLQNSTVCILMHNTLLADENFDQLLMLKFCLVVTYRMHSRWIMIARISQLFYRFIRLSLLSLPRAAFPTLRDGLSHALSLVFSLAVSFRLSIPLSHSVSLIKRSCCRKFG